MLSGTPEGMMSALQHLEQAFQLSPNYHNAVTNYAYMKFRFAANSMQSIESSRQLFDKAVSQFPKQAEVYVMYGQVSIIINKMDHVISTIRCYKIVCKLMKPWKSSKRQLTFNRTLPVLMST